MVLKRFHGKRIVSWILCLCMLLSALPVMAGAEATPRYAVVEPCIHENQADLFPQTGPTGYDDPVALNDEETLFRVQRDQTWAVVDKRGNVVLPFSETYVKYVGSDANGTPWYIALKGGSYKSGNWCVLDAAGQVTAGGYTYIQARGYAAIGERSFQMMPTVSVRAFELILPQTGQLIRPESRPPIVDYAGNTLYTEPYFDSIVPSDDNTLFVCANENEVAVYDDTGKLKIAPGQFEKISAFYGGRAMALLRTELFIIDADGQKLVGLGMEFSVPGEMHNGQVVVTRWASGYQSGVIDLDGQWIIPISYTNISFESGLYQLTDTRDPSRNGLADQSGKLVYRGDCTARAGSLVRTQNTLSDLKGNTLIAKGRYDHFWFSFGGSLSPGASYIEVQKNGKNGVCDLSGREIAPCIYTNFGWAYRDRQMLYQGEKSTLIDASGKVLVPLGKYTLYDYMGAGHITCSEPGQSDIGLLSPSGQLVLPCLYTYIADLDNGYVLVIKDGQYAVYDLNGNVAVPFGLFSVIEKAEGRSPNDLAVWQNGKWGLIELEPIVAVGRGTPSSWAQSETKQAALLGLLQPDDMRDYQKPITRAEFCQLIVRLMGQTGKPIWASYVRPVDYPFADVTDDYNIFDCYGLGIVDGDAKGWFNPDSPITRQEAAKILTNTAKVLGVDITAVETNFADSDKIADWAVQYVNYVSAAGIMLGTGNNRFSPTGTYTREQAVLTMLRLWNIE